MMATVNADVLLQKLWEFCFQAVLNTDQFHQ